MRTISQPIINALTSTRNFNLRATIRDQHLVFDQDQLFSDKGLNFVDVDADVYNDKLLIVGMTDTGRTYYMYTDPPPPGSPWPNWTFLTDAFKEPTGLQTSRLGLYKNALFGRSTAEPNKIIRLVFNGSTWTDGGSITYATTGTHYTSIAPVSETAFFVIYHSGYDFSVLKYLNVSSGTSETYPGRILADDGDVYNIDAERIGETDYVYFSARLDPSISHVTRTGKNWSQTHSIMPIEQTGGQYGFRVRGVSQINGKLVATLYHKRATRVFLYLYSIGPEKFTLGRESYLAGGANTPSYRKLLKVGDYLYLIGHKALARAESRPVFGADLSSRKQVFTRINNIRYQQESNSPATLTLDLPAPEISDLPIKGGMELILEAGYNGNYAQIGRFEVDVCTTGKDASGTTRHVIARGMATRRLAEWACDVDLDYWSQGYSSNNIRATSGVVRQGGEWVERSTSGFSGMTPRRLNDPGFIYSTVRTSRGMQVSAGFYYEAGSNPDNDTGWRPEFGVVLYYFKNSQPLGGWPQGEYFTEKGDCGYYVLWGKTNHNGGPGFRVVLVDNGQITHTLATWAHSMTPRAANYIRAEFNEGLIRVFTHNGDYRWTQTGSSIATDGFRRGNPDGYAWIRNNIGRGGVFVNNGTWHTRTPGFQANSGVIPVESVEGFDYIHTDYVIVDDEIIKIEHANPLPSGYPSGANLEVQEAYIFKNSPRPQLPNPNPWIPGIASSASKYLNNNRQTWFFFPANPNIGQANRYNEFATDPGNRYWRCALAIVDGPGKGSAARINEFIHWAWLQWHTEIAYALPDHWMDHVGVPFEGSWVDKQLCALSIRTQEANNFRVGSVCKIYPAISIEDYTGSTFEPRRGMLGTKAASHGNTLVSVYREHRIIAFHMEVATTDIDKNVEDIATEIARKAGVETVVSEKSYSGNYNYTHSGWDIAADLNRINLTRYFNVVCKLKVRSGDGFIGIHVGPRGDRDAMVIGLDRTAAYRYDYNASGNLVLKESFPLLADRGTSWITFSIAKDRASIWIENRLACTFGFARYTGTTEAEFTQIGIVANNPVNITVDWPELDTRVDNFIMEMGQTGLQLLDRLISRRRIFFQDDQDGNLRLFRTRPTVDGTYGLSISSGEQVSTTQLATRMQLDGLESYEYANYDLMKEYGVVYSLTNANELEDYDQFVHEGELMAEDVRQSIYPVTVTGAVDPRIEANDKLVVQLNGQSKTVIARSINWTAMSTPDAAIFDMQIGGVYA